MTIREYIGKLGGNYVSQRRGVEWDSEIWKLLTEPC